MPRPAPYGFSRDVFIPTIPFPAGTGQVTSLTLPALGFQGTVEKVSIYSSVAAAGAAASRTFNVRKTSVTGTVVATATVVLTDLSTVGVQKAIAVSTTAGVADFTDTDVFVIEWATAGAVAFTAGVFHVILVVRQLAQKRA